MVQTLIDTQHPEPHPLQRLKARPPRWPDLECLQTINPSRCTKIKAIIVSLQNTSRQTQLQTSPCPPPPPRRRPVPPTGACLVLYALTPPGAKSGLHRPRPPAANRFFERCLEFGASAVAQSRARESEHSPWQTGSPATWNGTPNSLYCA